MKKMRYLVPALVIVVALLGVYAVLKYVTTDHTFVSVQAGKTPQQTNTINLIKTYFESYNARQANTYFGTISSNVVNETNQGNAIVGLETFKVFMHAFMTSFDSRMSQIVLLVSDDGRYASASWVNTGTYVKSDPAITAIPAKNQKYTVHGANFFEVSDGKIARITTYYNAEEFAKQLNLQG